MRRLVQRLPWLGLLLLAVALVVRALRPEGLGLRAFPAPPEVLLADFEPSVHAAHVAGRVLDASGAPVAEALLVADLAGELAFTYSDATGAFELAGVPPGELVLEVVARRFRAQRFPAGAPADALELVLDEPLAELDELPALARGDLAGEVTTPAARRGLLGYEVVLLPAGPVNEPGRPVPVRAEVAADRSFRLPGLLFGEYRVAILPPWARGGTWPNLCAEDARTFVHGPTTPRVGLPLAAGEVHGRVLDEDGDAVAGAQVLVTPADDPRRLWPPVSSAADGSFEVGDLPPGDYRVAVRAGEGRWEQRVAVLAGHTSVLDVPPLALRVRR
ncbi:MAG: carboxypeptidase regulatory-like domain-containing protein [Planctomycetes bacterium]|nr:carboxypeptidase regulatory-like domain-containing protein [Planctomycetota bacterium]